MKIAGAVKEFKMVKTVRTHPETFIGCHPERNEGFQSFGKLWKHQRFFARHESFGDKLRMTNSGEWVSG
jgi:hypothetical protein